MQIRALSLTQPWANLVAEGLKTIETRRWGTPYRGWLLVCATKERRPHCPGPYGVALAVAHLVDCRPMTAADEAAACCPLCGGAWAWVLEGVQAFPVGQQFPVRGQLGLFTPTLVGPDWEIVRRAVGARGGPPLDIAAMTGFFDVRCGRCGRRFGWYGRLAERPPCPGCGARPEPSLFGEGPT